MRRVALAVGLTLALLVPVAAQAHVSLHPNQVPADSVATLNIRVPNETENAETVKLTVKFPPGFVNASTAFMPGWIARVVTGKLPEPVQTEDGEVTRQVREIVWSGDGITGLIPPGTFLNFPISIQIPDQESQALTFPVVQYYDGGEVVRWTGPPDSENPAPQIESTAAGGLFQDAADSGTVPPDSPITSPDEGGSSSSESASEGLGIAALIVGGLGLIAGCAALVRSRRPA